MNKFQNRIVRQLIRFSELNGFLLAGVSYDDIKIITGDINKTLEILDSRSNAKLHFRKNIVVDVPLNFEKIEPIGNIENEDFKLKVISRL